MNRFWIVMAAAMLASATARAEIMQGKVLAADANGTSLAIRRENPRTGEWEEVRVRIDRDTDFSGFGALSEIGEGDEVMVDAMERGGWRADSVVLTESASNAVNLPPSYRSFDAPDNARSVYDQETIPGEYPDEFDQPNPSYNSHRANDKTGSY